MPILHSTPKRNLILQEKHPITFPRAVSRTSMRWPNIKKNKHETSRVDELTLTEWGGEGTKPSGITAGEKGTEVHPAPAAGRALRQLLALGHSFVLFPLSHSSYKYLCAYYVLALV